MMLSLALLIAQGPNAGRCPNGECGYEAGYSTAETIALVAFGAVVLAVVVAIVLLVRRWRG